MQAVLEQSTIDAWLSRALLSSAREWLSLSTKRKNILLKILHNMKRLLPPLKVSFNENEFITLILFVFSVGVIGFKNSILRKKLYKDIFDLVSSELMK